MKSRRWLIVLLVLGSSANAKTPAYETGKLADLVAHDLVSNMPNPIFWPPGPSTIPLPLGRIYQFRIEAHDIAYLADCLYRASESEYKFEWAVNDSVEFRVHKHSVFLKRANGKEMRLALVTRFQRDATSAAWQAIPGRASHQTVAECR